MSIKSDVIQPVNSRFEGGNDKNEMERGEVVGIEYIRYRIQI